MTFFVLRDSLKVTLRTFRHRGYKREVLLQLLSVYFVLNGRADKNSCHVITTHVNVTKRWLVVLRKVERFDFEIRVICCQEQKERWSDN